MTTTNGSTLLVPLLLPSKVTNSPDNNQTNQTTARDLAIMTYNFIKKYPDLLKYTSKPASTVKKEHLRGNLWNHNYLFQVPKLIVDGLETDLAQKVLSTILIPSSVVINVWLLSSWVLWLADQTGEEIRHTFGNARWEDVQRLLLQESS